MFIFTARLDRKRLILLSAAALLLCAGTAALLLHRGDSPLPAAEESVKVHSQADGVAYLEERGWTVDPQSAVTEELRLPEEFDETYKQYLSLQASQGFDLTQYCGKRILRYSYAVTNYPTGESGVQASLLVYKDTVIGGEILSTRLDGFIHGLEGGA